jgi:hypothetical protein
MARYYLAILPGDITWRYYLAIIPGHNMATFGGILASVGRIQEDKNEQSYDNISSLLLDGQAEFKLLLIITGRRLQPEQ